MHFLSKGSKTASLKEVRISNVVLLHSIIMVSSNSLLELSLAQSVEDLDSQYDTYAGEFIADGQWTQYSDAPTPAFYVDSQGVEHSFRPSSATPSVSCAKRLTFVPLTNWDRDATYDEVPLTYIHYSIECKVMVNKKVIFKETEPDIVLDPASYWRLLLQPRVEELLKKNIIPPRSVRANNTNVVVSVTDRKERDLNKQFDETNIVWSVVEKQLIAWSDLFEKGKKLRVNICIHYVENGISHGVTNARTRNTNIGKSATQHMLAERAAQLDAEQAATGQPSAWRTAYSETRCPGPPNCDIGPYCWYDSTTKRRRKLKTHHLRAIVRHIESGKPFRSHDDMPDDLRQQIYAEEEQSAQSKRLKSAMVPNNFPPIQITNVLPNHASPEPEIQPRPTVKRIHISGLCDVAVQDYSEYQQSQVRDESLKAEFQTAANLVLAEGLDLEQLHEDRDPEFLIKQGVKRGPARRFMDDIEPWAKRRAQSELESSE